MQATLSYGPNARRTPSDWMCSTAFCSAPDALFDRSLISFDEQGVLVTAPALEGIDLQPLGISPGMKLRWLDALHKPNLALHRSRLLKAK